MLSEALGALTTPLPIAGALPRLLERLGERGAAVLVAPPGTGKTTLVPLALADRLPGQQSVVVAEPRRVAARAAAHRMAALLGEQAGRRVGYTVRGERRTGPGTRVEVVTTGVLVRRLQRDPELPGVGAIVLDECHERHLDTDLALAFTLESRAALRPDLLLLATSATAEADRLAAVLGDGGIGDGGIQGGPAPVVGADAPMYDVETVWCPPATVLDPPRGLRVDPRFLDHVAAVTRRALGEATGDVLVFLPGAGEIQAVAQRLEGRGGLGGVDVLRLHGRLGAREQDAVLRPARADGSRRVVLASAVAESSLTVPGVRVVVDSGLARVPRTDLARGLGGLTTVRASKAAAHQRAGRAGRQAPGVVYRCWSAAEHDRLPAQPDPEIAIADLTGFALALAQWGDPTASSLPLLDRPPPSAMAVAARTLGALGAVDESGRITPRGRRMAATGVHPRLARALLDGADLVGARRAAELVALLADDTLANGTDDLARARSRLRTGADPAVTARWRDESRRLEQALPTPAGGPARHTDARETASGTAGSPTEAGRAVPDDLAAGIIAGLAHPDRLARSRAGGSAYLMAGGTAAELSPGSGLGGSRWLAVAVAQRQAGAPTAKIRLAAAIDEATAREVGAGLLVTEDQVAWDGGDVVARRVEQLGAVPLVERALEKPPRPLVEAALLEGLTRTGLGLLTWTPTAETLRARLAFCHWLLGPAWPSVTDADLLPPDGDADPVVAAGYWLLPDLSHARRRADLTAIDVTTALRRLLDHRQVVQLNTLAPERIAVPSGSAVRLTYSHQDPGPPVLAVKLQEVFGWADAPTVGAEHPGGGVPVVLHLLSPAGRPVAVTSDLKSFWANGYPAVRAELRGRYPRHSWPKDPTTATPTRRTTPRRA